MRLEYIGEHELDFRMIGLVRTGYVREVKNTAFARELLKSGLWRKPKKKKNKKAHSS